MKLHTVTLLMIGFISSLALLSCGLDEMKLSNHETETVCFSTDIMPIVNQNCNSIGCHVESDIKPKLSPAAKAYKDLIILDMINLKNPSNSEFYKRMIDIHNADSITISKDANISVLVLKWIEEGAKDN